MAAARRPGAFEAREEFRVNFRLLRGDGTYRPVDELDLPRVDARGTFRGYFALCFDVTEREQAEQALERSILLDYLTLEALPGSVVIVARGGQILEAKPPEALAALGHPLSGAGSVAKP